MECKGYDEDDTKTGNLSIDLTRMECKAEIGLETDENSRGIDLTRMECKDIYR